MAENKTKATNASVEDYIEARANAHQRVDCAALTTMLEAATGAPPTLWGPSIVGFGKYQYTYESGHGGEMPLVGYAIRGRELVLYVNADSDAQRALLSRLGPHKMGKSCLYVKKLQDLDVGVLERIVANSVAEVRRRHG